MRTYNLHTKNFTLDEFTYSSKAEKAGISNEVETTEQLQAIANIMANVLQPVRDKLGFPITISSGYRNSKVNKIVNGSATSQHMKGQAADLQCFSNKKFDVKRTRELFKELSEMDVDQLLYERDSKGNIWVHVSYVSPEKNRHFIKDNYYAG